MVFFFFPTCYSVTRRTLTVLPFGNFWCHPYKLRAVVDNWDVPFFPSLHTPGHIGAVSLFFGKNIGAIPSTKNVVISKSYSQVQEQR